MRAVCGAGLGARSVGIPWARSLLIHTGQSLSVGYLGQPPLTTTQPHNNGKLFDSSSTYDTTNPTASTLSRIPLVAPLKSLTGSGIYPHNIAGESPEVCAADQLTAMMIAEGAADFPIDAISVGEIAAGMSVIEKGGTEPSYAGSIFECAALAHIASLSGISVGVIALMLTHGETDALLGTDWGARAIAMRDDTVADTAPITGQTRPFMVVISQQNASPNLNAGQFFESNLTANQQWKIARDNPTKAVCVGPKYHLPYQTDGLHLLNVGYQMCGEKYGQVLFELVHDRAWSPLQPTAIARSGTTVTVSLHVPVGALVFDTVKSPPHQSGALVAWAGGKGFEAYDRTMGPGAPSGVHIVSMTNASPIVITTDNPHNLTTGDSFYGFNAAGNTAGNGLFTVTVISPTQFSLDGSTGNGTYTGFGCGLSPIAVTAPAISGSNVTFTLGRAPVGNLSVAYADHADAGISGGGTGGFPSGRCGLLRDSDPFVGAVTGTAQQNWCVEFSWDGIA